VEISLLTKTDFGCLLQEISIMSHDFQHDASLLRRDCFAVVPVFSLAVI